MTLLWFRWELQHRWRAMLFVLLLTALGTGVVLTTAAGAHRSATAVTRLGAVTRPADVRSFDPLFTSYDTRMAQVALRPGTDPSAATGRLTAALGKLGADGALGAAVQPTDPLTEQAQIDRVRWLPSLLGGFLAALALAAAAHALLTAARRRGHELAVLRAVGMTPRQARDVSLVQGVVLAAVGLALGLPLGVALGRTIWRVVAGYYPLQYVGPLPVRALLLAVPCAFGLMLLLAALPARRAARMRVADILRAE